MNTMQPTRPQSAFVPDPLRGVGAMEAVRRHPFLAVLPLVLLLGAAVAYGLLRSPVYTAESRQAVGRIDTNQPGALAGFASATEALASNYSRAIEASPVVRRAARGSGFGVREVRRRISATPIPESPVFRVIAIGEDERQAVGLANAAASGLRDYITNLNSENPNADRQLKAFEAASLDAARRQSELDDLRDRGGPNPSDADRRAIAEAKSGVDTARLGADVARLNYTSSKQSQGNAELIQTITRARVATNDRFARLQIALFIAVALGVLLGLAAAIARSNRDVRRASTAN